MLIGAGLPQVARLAGDAKSYAERLFRYPNVGPLTAQEAALAVEKPNVNEGAAIEPAALELIVQRTSGYPFFLQEWAYTAWNDAQGSLITADTVELAYSETLSTLDSGFFRVRVDRLTKTEIQFVKTMATLGDGPYAVADIAKSLGRSQ